MPGKSKSKQVELLPDEPAADLSPVVVETPAGEVTEADIVLALTDDEKLADILRLQFEDGSRKLRKTYWAIGTIIVRVQESMAGEPDRVTERIRKIARKLARAERLLWDAAKFAREFPQLEQVERMAIDWTAVRAVLTIPDQQKRAELMSAPDMGDLTVAQVKERVKDAIENVMDRTPEVKPPKKKTKKEQMNEFADPICVFDKLRDAVAQVTEDFSKFQSQVSSDVCELNSLLAVLPGVIAKATDDKYPEEWFGQVVDLGTEIWKELQSLRALTCANPPNESAGILADHIDEALVSNFVDIQDVKASWKKGVTT